LKTSKPQNHQNHRNHQIISKPFPCHATEPFVLASACGDGLERQERVEHGGADVIELRAEVLLAKVVHRREPLARVLDPRS
jgi:hypothetical protein